MAKHRMVVNDWNRRLTWVELAGSFSILLEVMTSGERCSQRSFLLRYGT